MVYRILILKDENECSEVIDDLIVSHYRQIEPFIREKGYADKVFALYEREVTINSINDNLVGYYKLK